MFFGSPSGKLESGCNSASKVCCSARRNLFDADADRAVFERVISSSTTRSTSSSAASCAASKCSATRPSASGTASPAFPSACSVEAIADQRQGRASVSKGFTYFLGSWLWAQIPGWLPFRVHCLQQSSTNRERATWNTLSSSNASILHASAAGILCPGSKHIADRLTLEI